jgi:hypothetical protein
MKTEEQQLQDMYARIRQVFPRELLDTFAPQQETLTDNAINRILNKDGPEALTVDRLEGIKELVTQHLWSPALTELTKNLPALEQETSETLDSTQAMSNDSETSLSDQPIAEESVTLPDLQNLSVDPALAPMQDLDQIQ